MLRRGLAFCLVLGLGTVARAGAVIDFTVGGAAVGGCYTTSQAIDVDVRLKQSAGGANHYLRFTQLDFTATNASLKAGLTLPVTHGTIHFWNFNGVPNCPTPTTAACGAGHYIEDSLSGSRANVISRTYFFTDPNSLGENAQAQTRLLADGTPLVLGTIHLVLPAAPGDYTLDVLNSTQTNADLGGADVRFGFSPDAPAPADPITKWHAGTDITGGTQVFHVQAAGTCPTGFVTLTTADPLTNHSLWRTAKNIVRLKFNGPINADPAAGDVKIRELIAGAGCGVGSGTFGADLSSGFTIVREGACVAGANAGKPCVNDAGCPGSTCALNTVLRIQETSAAGGPLVHRKWYEISSAGFSNVNPWGTSPGGTAPFVQYVVQMGDCTDNGLVQANDAGCVYAGVPCVANCGDNRRQDISGDNRIQATDAGLVYARVPSLTVAKPCGH